MKRKKLAIIGGSGFIGKNLVEYFSQKKKYVIFSTYHNSKKPKIKNVIWKKIDLKKKSEIDKFVKNKDIIIHAAAVTTGSKDILNRPHIHVSDNLIMNTTLLKSIFENKIKRFIYFSCTVMYPSSKSKHKETAKIFVDDKSPYFGVANMKLNCEQQCLFFSKISKTKFTILRHSNVYGKYDKFDPNKSHVLANSINKALNNNKTFKIWGNGKSVRNFIYINDLVKFVDNVINLQKKNYEIYNVASDENLNITQLSKKIIKLSGKNKKISYQNNGKFIDNSIKIDNSKAKKLNWKCEVKINEGLRETIK